MKKLGQARSILAMRNPGVLSIKVKIIWEQKLKVSALKPMLDYLFYMGYF
nr:hypothetical protein [Mycoplasmopsis bovis]